MKVPGIVRHTRNAFCLLLFMMCGCCLSAQQNAPTPVDCFLKQFPNVRDWALSPKGDEAYFTIQSPLEELGAIACSRKVKGTWKKPELVNFTGRYRDIEPFVTKDGLRLYFSSNRPLNDTTMKVKDYDIWYVERKGLYQSWSAPVNISAPVNTGANEFYPSLADNGNLYFTSDGFDSKGKDNIYFSEWKANHFSAPVSLDSNINTEGYEFNAFIAPDESFLIYTGYNRRDGLGSGDLYISFKSKAGWTAAQNMGAAVNSKQMDYCPFVDTRTATLYFTSRRSQLSNKTFRSITDFEKEINRYENGLSRVYKIFIGSMPAKK